MPKLALWLLNRVTQWDREAMGDALREAARGPHQVTFGHRAGCQEGVLMNETPDADEYFIPIPVKCLGDPRLLEVPGPGWRALDAILRCYAEYYQTSGGPVPPHPWSKYWELEKQQARRRAKRKRVFGDLRMVSPHGEGYYRALQRYTAEHPGTRHVLVGYSQGGLVARYLAHLDEQLFGDAGIVHGVVTVEASNFGSPLARTSNADPIAQALALVAVGFAQIDEMSFPRVAAQLRDLSRNDGVGMGWLLRLLDGALTALNDAPTLKKKNQKLFSFLETARKWLSGLDGSTDDPVFEHQESAFFDLDLAMLGQPGRVLHAVNTFPLRRIWHGAIVGTDDRLDSFVDAVALAYVEKEPYAWILRRLVRWLEGHFHAELLQALQIPGEAYRQAMTEHGFGDGVPAEPIPAAIAERLQDFANGVGPEDTRYAFQTSVQIQKRAHDFVIPSVYQLIEKKSDTFLGNWVNPDASHLSGADVQQPAGQTSQQYLLKVLRRM
jgi:pimeloyl-ACP methyl ester carboxylesterase